MVEVLWEAEKLMVKALVEALVMLALVILEVRMYWVVAVRLVVEALVIVPLVDHRLVMVPLVVEAFLKMELPDTVKSPPR